VRLAYGAAVRRLSSAPLASWSLTISSAPIATLASRQRRCG